MFVPSFCQFIKYSLIVGTGMSVFESGSGRCHGWAGLGFLVLVILFLRLFSCRTL